MKILFERGRRADEHRGVSRLVVAGIAPRGDRLDGSRLTRYGVQPRALRQAREWPGRDERSPASGSGGRP